jgi:chaperonin GroES
MSFKPLHDWAVVRQMEEEEMTAGGLFIPETAKQKPAEGVVEAIGPGAFEEEKRGKKKEEQKERKFIPSTVKPGDIVLYERYAGHKVTVNEMERILVRERDILGVLLDRPAPRKAPVQPLQIPPVTTGQAKMVPAKQQQKAIVAAEPKAAWKTPVKAAKKAEAKPAKKAAKKAAKKTAAKPAKPKAAKTPAKKTSKKKR